MIRAVIGNWEHDSGPVTGGPSLQKDGEVYKSLGSKCQVYIVSAQMGHTPVICRLLSPYIAPDIAEQMGRQRVEFRVSVC